MSEGWIKLHRKLMDNPLWSKKPFSYGQAWVDILLLANHKPDCFWVRGNCVKVARGQIGRSEDTLASRWGWSRSMVRTFLKFLENEQQISQQKNRITSIITITNYEQYQENSQQDTQQVASKQPTDSQQIYTNKNVKNDKNEKNVEEVNDFGFNWPEFVAFWNSFSKNPVSSQDLYAESEYRKQAVNYGHDALMEAAKNHKNALMIKNSQAHPHSLGKFLKLHIEKFLSASFNPIDFDRSNFEKEYKDNARRTPTSRPSLNEQQYEGEPIPAGKHEV